MFGKIGDMMGKLQEVKKKMEEVKASLDTKKTEVSAAGGAIKISINGNRKIQSIDIAPALQNAPKEEFQLQLMTAINQAIEEADKISAEEMKKVAGGLIPPGLL